MATLRTAALVAGSLALAALAGQGAPAAIPTPAAIPASAAGAGEASCAGTAGWQVGRGELLAGPGCSGLLLGTDASDHDESLGEASFAREVRLPLEVQVRWRRLGPEAGRPLWLKLLGGHLLFKDGAVGLWINRTQFAASGWTRLPGLAIHDEHLVSVRQTREAVEVRIDGALAARLALAGPPRAGKLAIGLNGARGYRSFLSFRDFSVRESQ